MGLIRPKKTKKKGLYRFGPTVIRFVPIVQSHTGNA